VPQASNWRMVQNRASCGSCHDDIDWTAGDHPGGLVFIDDSLCAGCHNETSGLTDLHVPVVHRQPEREAGEKFEFNIQSISNTGIGEFPVVEFSVTDPTNGDAPYDIQNDSEFTTCAGGASRLAIGIAWDTADYHNNDSGNSPGLGISMNPLSACGGTSTALGGGVFSVTSPTAVPATAGGSLAVTIDGHPAVDIDGTVERIAVTNVVAYAPITDAEAMPRRDAVVIEKCDDCHSQLSMHGNNRTDNIQVCVTCHAPNVTDVNRRAGQCEIDLGLDDTSVDMKYMIHRIHASGATGVPYEVCGFGNSTHIYNVVYPGKLNNCEGCHKAGEYYPVDPAEVLGTTVDTGADLATPTDDVAISPNSSACSGCHTSELAKNHMEQNGGDFSATKAADSTLISSGAETCALCHGEGRSADVTVVHGIDTFESN
jgi:OmcA/MtrC family decaheme c-type cytochrome